MRETASPKLPNVFLVDVTTDEVPGVKDFFAHQAGVTQALDLLPMVMGRFVSINGQTLDQMKGQHFPRRMLENAELSYADAPPEGDKVARASGGLTPAQRSLPWARASRTGCIWAWVQPWNWKSAERCARLKVTAMYRADGQHLGARVSFVLPSAQLKDQTATWYGGAHIDPKQVAAMERALVSRLTLQSRSSILPMFSIGLRALWIRVTFVVRFLAGFSIFAGLMILASSIASTRFRRMREAVVLKTLGATRMRIVRTFSVEFSVLGLLAGTVGVVFANLLTRVLLQRLDVGFHIEWSATLIALVGTAVLATATGWIASYRILGLRPLEVLREE